MTQCWAIVANLKFSNTPFDPKIHLFELFVDDKMKYNVNFNLSHECHTVFSDMFEWASTESSEGRRLTETFHPPFPSASLLPPPSPPPPTPPLPPGCPPVPPGYPPAPPNDARNSVGCDAPMRTIVWYWWYVWMSIHDVIVQRPNDGNPCEVMWAKNCFKWWERLCCVEGSTAPSVPCVGVGKQTTHARLIHNKRERCEKIRRIGKHDTTVFGTLSAALFLPACDGGVGVHVLTYVALLRGVPDPYHEHGNAVFQQSHGRTTDPEARAAVHTRGRILCRCRTCEWRSTLPLEPTDVSLT